jgi:hypothetical protein
MKTVAVIQSSYIPWKGYFDLIHDADEFVFYDDVKYTKNSWRNRNMVKGPNGVFWLTIPVSKDAVKLRIDQVQIIESTWQKKHLMSIQHCYSRAPYFEKYIDFFKQCYTAKEWVSLSEFNQYVSRKITKLLGITAKFHVASELHIAGNRTDRLVAIVKALNGERYVSGPSAKGYIEPEKFRNAGIELVYKDYVYPEYPQLWGGFEHNVSILDLLFNTGEKFSYYIWGHRQDK